MSAPWAVGVVIPARDEADRIERCVDAVVSSLEGLHAWVVVIADRCLDSTAGRARARLGDRGEVHAMDAGTVGAARRCGARRALRRLAHPPERTWLLTTDADTRVPRDWVRRHLERAEQGVHAVAGCVTVDDFDEHPLGTEARFVESYAIHADGTHPHVHGCNLGVRADAYVAVGGWPAIALAEDHALWGALRDGGFQQLATAESVVTTSGRARGRAPGGFADTLRALGAR